MQGSESECLEKQKEGFACIMHGLKCLYGPKDLAELLAEYLDSLIANEGSELYEKCETLN